MNNILDLTKELGIPNEYVQPYGWDKAKIDYKYREVLKDRPDGKLVLVTAITPTKAGEGKTTTTIGLHDGLRRIGVNSLACLREPSLGPVWGIKGGAVGALKSTIVPSDDINLHFTGDFHALTSTINLMS
ncbi:MAG: formate--tetrahydrofolate ligase, partial [Candidatus Riflebacteria bacterium]|nr:formate--tetrahydrofolate ligase [Candidatus Riflebacteria bacterium]